MNYQIIKIAVCIVMLLAKHITTRFARGWFFIYSFTGAKSGGSAGVSFFFGVTFPGSSKRSVGPLFCVI